MPFLVYVCMIVLLDIHFIVCDLADCIGSAFNVKGAMQCPNCRKIEKGQWLYANGGRAVPEFSMDDWAHEEELYEFGYSEMVIFCNEYMIVRVYQYMLLRISIYCP